MIAFRNILFFRLSFISGLLRNTLFDCDFIYFSSVADCFSHLSQDHFNICVLINSNSIENVKIHIHKIRFEYAET